MYQVTGNNKVREHSFVANVPGVFELFLIWESKIYLYTSGILVPVYLRVTVLLKYPNGIHVHDGPGMNSDQINNNKSVIHLSSFQAFVVVFTNIMSNKYEMNQSEFGLTYIGRYTAATKVHIDNSQTLNLPPCTVLRSINTELHKMSDMREGNLHHVNLHCVYNITSDSGYVNLSIAQLTYIGVHYEHLIFSRSWIRKYMHCLQGGVAFEKQKLCNNYTSKPGKYNDKYIMDIVSGTKKGLIFVAYSFKGYSQVSVKATVTSTPCRGLFNEGKYSF